MSARRIVILLLLAGGLTALILGRVYANPPRTVVLISIDTLRPERLGVYGGQPGTSPNIDELAKTSVVFDQVLANSPWTLPSHMTMLTGLDPVAHGVRRDGYHLSGRVTTLAEALRDAGFRTGGFTAGGFVAARYGFGEGFSVYRESYEPPGGGASGFSRILPEALEWLGRSRQDTFLFLHTFDVHAPYDTCDPETLASFRSRPVKDGADDYQLHRLSYLYQQNKMRVTEYARIGELLNDYDAGVHMADAGVGQVIEALRATGRLDNALIIVTSDHGESFADHGVHIGHGIGLTDDELHVPLLMRLPHDQFAGKRIGTLVDLVDLAPTVLDVMGVPAPHEMAGESLAKLAAGTPRHRDYVMGLSQNTEACFLVRDGFKFILSPSIPPMDIAKRHLGPMTPDAPGADPGDEYELGHDPKNPILLHYDVAGDPLGIRDVLLDVPQLYDRAKDPQERDNLWKQDPKRVEVMSGFLKELYLSSAQVHKDLDDGLAPEPVDPHVQTALSQLGYLAAADATEQRANYDQLPIALRAPLSKPYEPPDTGELIEGDQAAQFTRRRIEDGDVPPDTVQRALQSIGNKYVAWAVKNPDCIARVRWRVEALTELAQKAGVELDMDLWRKRFLSLEAKVAKEQHQVAPPPAPLQDPPPDPR